MTNRFKNNDTQLNETVLNQFEADLNAYADNAGQIAYTTCLTSAAIVAKTVAITNFTLTKGVKILIKMTYAHTSTTSATLNVASTGAKTILNSNAAFINSTNSWNAGEYLLLVYDGANWIWVNSKPKMTVSNGVLTIYTA